MLGCFSINVHLADTFVHSDFHDSYLYSHTDGGGCHARCRPPHQEQFGVQYLATKLARLETSPWISASFSNLKLKGHSVVFLKNFFFFYLIKLNYQLYLFSWLNKQTDLRGQHNLYCLTLFMCGRPCHLSSFKQCSGTLFSPENSLLIHWWNNICIITSLPLWILKLPVWIFQHYVLPL